MNSTAVDIQHSVNTIDLGNSSERRVDTLGFLSFPLSGKQWKASPSGSNPEGTPPKP